MIRHRLNVYEDNGGFYHLAATDDAEKCVYYFADNDQESIAAALRDYRNGFDPVDDGWECSEEDPQACFDEIRLITEARRARKLDESDIAALVAKAEKL